MGGDILTKLKRTLHKTAAGTEAVELRDTGFRNQTKVLIFGGRYFFGRRNWWNGCLFCKMNAFIEMPFAHFA